jgi:heat shock protein HslJ
MMRYQWRVASLAITAALALLPGLVASASESSEPDTPLALGAAGRLPLQGTPWRLDGYLQRGREAVPGPEVAAWMTLGAGEMRGSGGCSAIKGRYGSVGAAMTFRVSGPRATDCAEPTSLVQRAMLDGLRRTTSFEIVPALAPQDDQLVLRSASGEQLLRFGLDDVGSLEQADWRLTEYTVEGQATLAAPDQPAILSFQPARHDRDRRTSSGPAAASTGCNGVVAEFRQRASVVTFSGLEHTGAPCPPALAAQEQAMIAALESQALALALAPDQLTLTSDSGESLTFASQRPLEGSTWLLRAGAGDDLADAVTLRLQDGLASGEGPCGAYGATYATDGLFITFAEVEGAEASACDDSRSERRLLAGLRSSVLVQRDSSGLDMSDASGRVTLRFTSPMAP